MNAAETIQAAIDRLEKLKRKSTQGDWDILDGGDRFVAWHEDPASTGFDYIVSEPVEFERKHDAELIVTLHRTIDAQLAILRTAADDRDAIDADVFIMWPLELNLARAILGGAK